MRKIHEIGPYAIVEYHPRKVRSHLILETPDLRQISFHIYVDGQDESRSYRTLDAALAGAIAIRNDGINTRAGDYFIRMLGKKVQ